MLFSVTGIWGAYLGSTATHLVSASRLMLLFSGLMLVVGALMLTGRRPGTAANVTCSAYRCTLAGFAVGLVTGFLGVGGGFVIVPALVWFAGLDARRAIGTSLGIIAVNSAAGLAGQLSLRTVELALDWPISRMLHHWHGRGHNFRQTRPRSGAPQGVRGRGARSRNRDPMAGAEAPLKPGPSFSATVYFSTGAPFAVHSDMEPSYMRTSYPRYFRVK